MTDAAGGPASVAVAGSCATRDNFNSRFNPDYKLFYEVKVSANQTSMIALMSQPIEDAWTPLREMSDYDRWNVANDLTREFLPALAEEQPVYLILDFFGDVHFGVARLPDGRYLTDNRWKTRHTDFYQRHRGAGGLTLIKIQDDPDAYLALWAEAMGRFAEHVARTCPDTVVVVHRGWNAERVVVPHRPRPMMLQRYSRSISTLDVPLANELWARLDDHAITTHGWESIDLRDHEAPTYAEHPWGPFYVHYTPDYYHRFLAELHKITLRHTSDAATLARILEIESAAREPAERQLATERAAFAQAENGRIAARRRVAELEGLGVVRSLRFAVGQRVRQARSAAAARRGKPG